MPCTARPQPAVPSTLLRRVLLPFTSLLLLIGLALVGPAATAAPSTQGDAGNQASASAARKAHPKKHHAKKHHKKKHHKKKKRKHRKKHTTRPDQPATAVTGETRVLRAATIVLQQLGDPYRWGAAGPSAFDCSGLMEYSFGKAGIKIPRTSSAQAGRAHHIPRSKLRRGDLMYFTQGGRVYHTAMFLRWSKGTAQMVHAPGTGKRVRLDTPWTNSWFAATMR